MCVFVDCLDVCGVSACLIDSMCCRCCVGRAPVCSPVLSVETDSKCSTATDHCVEVSVLSGETSERSNSSRIVTFESVTLSSSSES